MKQFMWGALTVETLVAAFFFARYWRVSGDRFFFLFSLSFLAMSLNWLALSLIDPKIEVTHYAYWLRLLAFLLIIVGIVDKNRRSTRS